MIMITKLKSIHWDLRTLVQHRRSAVARQRLGVQVGEGWGHTPLWLPRTEGVMHERTESGVSPVPQQPCSLHGSLSAHVAERLDDGSRGLQPTVARGGIRVAERRLSVRTCQSVKRRSATPARLVLHRGLKPTATFGRRSATKPNWRSTIRVRSSASHRTPRR